MEERRGAGVEKVCAGRHGSERAEMPELRARDVGLPGRLPDLQDLRRVPLRMIRV